MQAADLVVGFSLWIRAALGALVLLASVGSGAAHGQGAEPVWPTAQWETSTPEQQGMDSVALAKLVASGTSRSFDSLLVTRHGRIVLDAYYAPFTADMPHAINSSTKAVVSTLLAIAYKDGLLDRLDHPVLDFFSDRSIANVDERKKAITVQHLLNMTSGLDWDEGFEGGREQSLRDMGRSPDWVQFILDRPMAHAPGEVFYYNSGGSHLLSAIVSKLTGKSTADYAEERLFGLLGIARPFWRRDPQRLPIGGFGLAMRPRDMAKIGYLYLRNGAWAGKQLLPADFLDAVNHASIDMNSRFDPSRRYANQFWAIPDKHVYMTVGYHCQVIMVLPERDIVAVMTASNFCSFGKLADEISGAIKSEQALPADTAAAELLAKAIADVSTEKPTQVGATPATASAISGRTYKFPDNDLGIKTLTLFLADENPRYVVETNAGDPARRHFDGPIGLGGLYRKSATSFLGVRAVKGAWKDQQTFVVDLQYVGLGDAWTWTLTYDGDKVALRGKARDGREGAAEGVAGG
ncbi:serine hydrolase domain-containing protein [Bradyrhizobium elkanii]|uniref:serine hydrolase domain-containing protein n=1 Tax=Bradyrhizobium elkanii TaxID=29448 RepID=UPI001BA4D640|nr:serine hydrolase [Bradyrhizobium elkanii]MBR1160920.1 serine hydrolase [Bradyrhizobium elkanii]